MVFAPFCVYPHPRLRSVFAAEAAVGLHLDFFWAWPFLADARNLAAYRARFGRRSYIRHEKFAEEVKRNARLIVIPDEWKEKFLARIETWESEVSQEKQQKIDALKSELTSLKAKIDRINNGFADGTIEIEEFKELKNPLVPQKADLEQQIVALERSKLKRLEPLRKWVLYQFSLIIGTMSQGVAFA